jgi:hypothetical protein
MVFIAPAIAFVAFLTFGFVCWSYRDVANRHSDRVPNAFGQGAGHDDAHGAGH